MKYLVLALSILSTVAFCWGMPYAPQRVGSSQGNDDIARYQYDQAGNRFSDGHGQTIAMGLRGKPVTITQGGQSEGLKYGFGGQRYLREHANRSLTLYLEGGAVEYRVPDSGLATNIVYIRRGVYSPVAQVDTKNAAVPKHTYYLRDHLGSPLHQVDDTGNPLALERRDPWGQAVSGSGLAVDSDEKHRGFTGHETIAIAHLIHMNGRIYDPAMGLFLGPDPVVRVAHNLTNLSRYGYLNFSPVNGIDPSGYTKEDLPHINLSKKERSVAGAANGAVERPPTVPAHPSQNPPHANAPGQDVAGESNHLDPRLGAEEQVPAEPRLIGRSSDSAHYPLTNRAIRIFEDEEIDLPQHALHHFEVFVNEVDGKLWYQGAPLNTSLYQGRPIRPAVGNEVRWMFVMNTGGNIYTGPNSIPGFSHASFFAGADAAAAGEWWTDVGGSLTRLNRRTGHYRTGPDEFEQFIQELRARGAAVPGAAIDHRDIGDFTPRGGI